MKKLLFLFVALVATTTLWASNTITYTATEKLPETTDEWRAGLHTNAFNVEIISHEFSNGVGTITFAGEVTTIGNWAFLNCYDLISVTIPNSVTKIGDAAFSWNSKLTLITIPKSVTTIGEGAFAYCSGLTSIYVEAGNTHYCSVDGVLFNYAKDTLIQYPASNSRIEYIIPNSVTTIENNVFYRCSGLISVFIPNSVTTIGETAFQECGSLASVDVDAANTHYCSIDGVLFNYAKDTLILYPAANTRTEYTIPNSVTTIGYSAFAYCNSLTSVTIPNSVTMIEYQAFYGSGVKNVEVAWTSEEQLPSMGWGAFESIANWAGPSYATLHVPEGTKSIYKNADQWKDFGTITDKQPDPKNCVITYTATEKLPEAPDEWSGGLHTNAFNVAIISHEFSNGIGTITFAGEVTMIGDEAFYYCYYLTSIAIPNSVTTIGDHAFEGCSFTSVTIPNSVTTIGNSAFSTCFDLTSFNVDAANTHFCSIDGVLFNYAKDTLIQHPISDTRTEYTIPNSVTTIRDEAFYWCEGLSSITIGNSVTTIGNRAFTNCYSLTSIDVNAANTHYCSVDGVLFNYAKDVLVQYPIGNTRTEYIIPNSVTTIGNSAFTNSKYLISITIPNSVTTIGESAFSGCSGLTLIVIPNSVTTIGGSVFFGSGLRNVSVAWTSDEQLPSMGWGVFEGIADWGGPSYATLHVPEGTKSIYENADQWKDFGMITDGAIPDSNTITYTATEKLTSSYLEVGWTTFGSTIISHTFGNGTGTITCDGEITKIGDLAFAWCEGLTSVTIPNSVTAIKDMAFAFSGLTSVTIPNSVTTIERMAFYNCSNLTSITIPESVTSIGEIAFYWCEGLTSIDVDAANTHYCSIDGVLFNYAKDTLIQYPIGNTRTEYTVPNSVTTIEGSAFFSCSGLTSVMIPNSVTTIGESAFRNCPNLTSITIPNSVTTIEKAVFYECSGLTSVTIGNSVTTIGDMAFHSCSSLTSVTIPNSVTTIGDWTFYGCSGLTSVTIPNSATTIGEGTFASCTGLTSVTIGNSVTTIGDWAFAECIGLTSITCYAVTPPKCGDDVFANVFEYISQNTKVYVPASALVDYQNAEVWKDMLLLPIAADVTPMDDENPIVIPTDQDVTITWAITDGADTYMLTISKNGETVCVLTFNAQGQLLNIAFAAPGHDGSHQAPAATLTEQGYQFTVTGLNPGTAYDYSVTATDAGGKTLAEHKGNFSTTGGTGLNTLPYEGKEWIGSKYFHNGNLIIERNGIKYTTTGQKVR